MDLILTKDEEHLCLKWLANKDITNPLVFEFVSDLKEYKSRDDEKCPQK